MDRGHGGGGAGKRYRQRPRPLPRTPCRDPSAARASADAEQEALAACAELRPYLRREFGWPLTELGRVRLQLGDLDGAEEAFLAAREAGWDPEPGLALLRLTQGDVALAAASIRDALDHPTTVPSKELPPNTDLRRAPLLAARVEIEVAAGDLAGARDAADELARVAAAFESRALAASAAMADGRVRLAAGDITGPGRDFRPPSSCGVSCGLPTRSPSPAPAWHTQTARPALRSAPAPILGCRRRWQKRCRPTTANRIRTPSASQATTGTYPSSGHTTTLRDLKGLHYIARLLSHPGKEFHVLDLASRGVAPSATTPETADPELASSGWGDSGALLDTQAKNAYRRRLAELDEDLDDARLTGDSGRVGQAEAERDFLIRELSRAVGLGGRDRRAGSASERARVSVTRAIRHAMNRIRKHNPALGDHLDRTIRTGTYCVYLPDTRTTASWRN